MIVTYTNIRTGRTARVDVPEQVAADWEAICRGSDRLNPVNWRGHRVRPYPAMDVATHAPYAPAGVYTDHADPAVEAAAYEMRDRLLQQAQGSRQEVLQSIATAFGMRHWRDAYNATRNVGRRITGESGRDRQSGELVWRRWARPIGSRQATERIAAVDPDNRYRHFGIEIEFGYNGSNLTADRNAIGRESRAAGVTFVDRWGNYGRATGTAGWQGTYDSTVDGGEIISDILLGDAASLDEVRDMLRRVRNHGGVARPSQGMHVHHDVRDFDRDDQVRLVDNLQMCQDALLAFVGNRASNTWCPRMTDDQFAAARRSVAAGAPVNVGRYVAWNMGRMHDRGAIEFRSLGHTLHGGKVRTWIKVGQSFMAATKAGYTFGPATTVPSMLRALREHGGLSTFHCERFARRCGVSLDMLEAA